MASLERRLEAIEAKRKRGRPQLVREALRRLSDEELDALEESPNQLIQQMKRREAEVTERQRAYAEESRRRGRELLERNRALIEAHRRRTQKGATQWPTST